MSVLDALLEGFESSAHPRGWHGRWIGTSSGKVLRVFHGETHVGDVTPGESRTHTMIGVGKVVGEAGRTITTKDIGTVVDKAAGSSAPSARVIPKGGNANELRGGIPRTPAFDPVSMLGREGTAARERGAGNKTVLHADIRDKLTNLPEGQRYTLAGPVGQVGHVQRTSRGFEVYTHNAAPEKVHKTPSAAAGHAMKLERSAFEGTPKNADVMARNYRHGQEVRAMNARQSQRAEAEAERQLEITARMASSSRERALAQTELERRRGARMARPRVREDAPSALGALLEGFAAEQQDPFPEQSFAMGDQVRVSVGGGARAITGKVVRAHGGPPATHAVVAPEGGGAHVLSPVGQVKLNTPAQHAAAAKRQEREEVRQQQQAHAQWMAAKPLGSQPPGAPKAKPAKAGPVREGLEVVLEAFGPAAPGETPAQSQKIGAQNVAQAQKSLASGWNASKHPRAQGGKFGYTTGGKRAKRGQKSSSRTLGVGAHGALVRSIQRQVGTPIDGKYGPQTRAAVARYQQQHGLQVDGVVGRQTLASLRGSVNARRVAPGPISSRQATVKASRAKAPAKAKAKPKAKAAKPVAPVRVAGGVLVH